MKENLAHSEEKPSGELRQLQLAILDLLKVFDQICKKNKLTYWIAYGSVLGAVRHGGFIPWDDDIDVCMPMEDYKKFLEIAKKELPEYILLCYQHKGSKYNKLFAKLMDRRTTLVEKNDNLSDGEFRGIYLDIFPYIQYPAIPERLTYLLIKILMMLKSRKEEFQKINLRNILRWLVISLLYVCFRILWNILAIKKGAYMELIPEDNGYVKRVHHDDIFPIKTLKFEDSYYPAPCNPDGYLRAIYGDYMTLPPVEKRVQHFLFFSIDKPYPHKMGIKK